MPAPPDRASQRLWLSDTWMTGEERKATPRRETLLPLSIAALDAAAWFGIVLLALLPGPLWVSLLLGLPAGLAIGVLFVFAHDAGHPSPTPHRRLDSRVGRLAFTPPIRAVSPWIVGQSRIDHGNTNLRGSDDVWEPMSPEDRAACRMYRGRFGALPCFLVGMWARKNTLPTAPKNRKEWRAQTPDTLFVIAANAVLVGVVLWLGARLAPDRAAWLDVLVGWGWPFLVFNAVIGWTICAHPTHPEIRWYADRDARSPIRASLASSVPANDVDPLDAVSNAIKEHNAHHALPGVPFYRLRGAQALLREKVGEIRTMLLTLRSDLGLMRACKLYDHAQNRWADFGGRPTGPRRDREYPAAGRSGPEPAR